MNHISRTSFLLCVLATFACGQDFSTSDPGAGGSSSVASSSSGASSSSSSTASTGGAGGNGSSSSSGAGAQGGSSSSTASSGQGGSGGAACFDAPAQAYDCPPCPCGVSWPVSWTPVPGATHYVIEWVCGLNTHTYQTSATTVELCMEAGLCTICPGGAVKDVGVRACNDDCCSEAVPFPQEGTPVSCGGGVCC